METRKRFGRLREAMRGSQGDYISSRASRTVDLYMIAICVLFAFALCSTSYNPAAQSPNLLEQMEGEFNDLSNNAISWNVYSESNQDTLAQYNIGLRSEWAGWTLETEPGYIEIYDASLPDVIPLCITQDWLNQFYVVVHAYGGYDFEWGTLKLEQEKTGKCYILDVVMIDQWTGDCCVDDYYRFELKLRQDPICFDANNFPTITGDFTEYHDPVYEDLNKEVTACFMSQWSGCLLDEQEFLIS